jgi:hypothetical protein
MLDKIRTDFSLLEGRAIVKADDLREISGKYHIAMKVILALYHNWKEDPSLIKFTNSEEEPMGALVDGIRERTLTRIREVEGILALDPYLTAIEISDKLFEKNRSKKRIHTSAINRLIRMAGFVPLKIRPRPSK